MLNQLRKKAIIFLGERRADMASEMIADGHTHRQ